MLLRMEGFFTGESVNRQITDSVGGNLTDSDLQSIYDVLE